ncbi:ubiquitin carboxyl-terminal hydrolase 16 [Arapaima gigas]
MGKKKGKDKNCREDENFDSTGPSCTHIRKGIDKSLLKKVLVDENWIACQDCKEEGKVRIQAEENGEAPPVWICLRCGHRGCGRDSENQHAIMHYKKPHSDTHCLVLGLHNWSVWCYLCDDDVQYSTTGQLAQLVSAIRRQAFAEPGKNTQWSESQLSVYIPFLIKNSQTFNVFQSVNHYSSPSAILHLDFLEVKEQDSQVMVEQPAVPVEKLPLEEIKDTQKRVPRKNSDELKGQKSAAVAVDLAVSVRGLSNLGNTCFFNAVVQNLSQTQLFRKVLKERLDGATKITITPDFVTKLEPLSIRLDQPGSLTVAMFNLLSEIQETKKGVVTPKELFTQVCKKAARFKGFQQQDSQELLRYLLDGMRAEELKRVSFGISEALKASGKKLDAEESKKLIKEYEKNGAPKNFVDQVFGGELTSTVMCKECRTVSLVTEMFLDLSLPVSDEAYRKKNQKKGGQKSNETGDVKQESPVHVASGEEGTPSGLGSKYQQKKAKKQAKKQAKNQRRQQKLAGKISLITQDSSEAEVGQELEAGGLAQEEASTHFGANHSQQGSPGPSGGQEDNKDVPAELEDIVLDTESVISNRFTALSAGEGRQEEEDEGEVTTAITDVKDEDELVEDLNCLALNTTFVTPEDIQVEIGCEAESSVSTREYTVVSQDPELAFCTLSTREAPEKQECSLQSCLYQFTEVEELTMNNSLLCVTCTKRQAHPKATGGTKKSVYTDGLKQMLISSPPPVLTLHLKRFQQVGYSVCKVTRHVQFPQILDLAPFCSATCKNVPEGETKVLYSLYGIVEHSGTMRSGHYTAYVKARPSRVTAQINGLTTPGEAEPLKGVWFHISDTSVQPVLESKVLTSQAYLLFYERVS